MNSTALNVASLRRLRTVWLRGLATLPLTLGAIAIAPAPASAHTELTSVDGHPVQGDFTLPVDPATETPAPAPTDGSAPAGPGRPEGSGILRAQGDAEPTPGPQPQADESRFGSNRWIFVALPMALFLAGLALVLVMARQSRRGERSSDPINGS